MPTVRSCCCGCTLRTGTLILLWLGAICTGLEIIFGTANNVQLHTPFPYTLRTFLINAVILGIHIMGIYGTEKERPSYLKPYLGFLVFCMVSLIIVMVLLPFIGVALFNIITAAAEDQGVTIDGAKASGGVAVVILVYEIILLLFLVLTYYFFVVVLCFYKELKQRKAVPPQLPPQY